MITYNAEKQIYKLDTKNTTYAFGFEFRSTKDETKTSNLIKECLL